MINVIKMDLFRMFKTKSMHVIWIIMIITVAFTTYLGKVDFDVQSQMAAAQQEQNRAESATEDANAESEESSVNIGMSVEMPTAPGERVTLCDMMFSNISSKFVALFIVIFAVIYSTADTNSGYIKNIGGQITRRSYLIISKTVAIFVYTFLTIAIFALVQALSLAVFFGYFELGDSIAFSKYMVTQMFLHVGFAIVCMVLAILIKNNLISMIIAVCMCMNMMSLLYGLVDTLLAKMNVQNFQVFEYTLSGRIYLLSMNPGNGDVLGGVGLAIVYLIVSVVAGCVVFEKRDLV